LKKRVLTKALTILLAVTAAALLGIGSYLLYHPEPEAEERQDTEESLADAYLEAAKKEAAEGTAKEEASDGASETQKETTVDPEHETNAGSMTAAGDTVISSTTSFSDDIYYYRGDTTYTPDYAEGTLIGVLEIDACKIRRGVYGGTWEEIQHDLDIWMVTEARPDYVIGETHFAIYGHNHPTQDLSFNRLKDLQIGDVFTFTQDASVYVYEVTRFIADWREVVTSDIVDNFDLPADEMYIITCGRGEYACKDIVYVGKLRGTVELGKYSKAPDYYKYDKSAFKSANDTDLSEENSGQDADVSGNDGAIDLVKTELTVILNAENKLEFICTDAAGNKVPCYIGIYDMDGLPVGHVSYPEQEISYMIPEEDTQYITGIVTIDRTVYEVPEDIVFTYHAGTIAESTINETGMDDNGLPVYVKPVIFTLFGIMAVLLVLVLMPRKGERK